MNTTHPRRPVTATTLLALAAFLPACAATDLGVERVAARSLRPLWVHADVGTDGFQVSGRVYPEPGFRNTTRSSVRVEVVAEDGATLASQVVPMAPQPIHKRRLAWGHARFEADFPSLPAGAARVRVTPVEPAPNPDSKTP